MTEAGHESEARTFVLRLWSETAGARRALRFSLEDPSTRARRSFLSLRQLGAFLTSLCRPAPAAPPRPRAASSRRAGAGRGLLALFLIGPPSAASALAEAPRVSLGRALGAPGATVALPIVVSSGDALPIGALSLQVRVDPASAASSVVFRRAGAWAGKRVEFEARPQAAGSFSWVVSLGEPAVAGSPMVVGEVVIRLARGLPPGSEIAVLLDPAVSGFGDRAGTRFVSVEAGGLVLEDGAVSIRDRVPSEERR